MLPQHSSASNEHYTPKSIIEAARIVLGSIEYDPASCETANKVVQASRYSSNSLDTAWVAETVFLNPPGGKIRNKSVQELFWKKLTTAYHNGEVGSAIFLSFSLELIPKCLDILDFPICFVGRCEESCVNGSGRIMFDSVDKSGHRYQQKSTCHGSCIVLLPSSVEQVARFEKKFSKFGRVVVQ